MRKNKIFISYSWSDKSIADKIYYDLTLVGFNVTKDSNTLKYTDRISEFMKRIGTCKFALIILSEQYLKSFNCMTEIMFLNENKNIWKKILPVVDKSLLIYNPVDRLKFVDYWQMKCKEVADAISKLQDSNVEEAKDELLRYQKIATGIDSFLINVKDILNCSPEELFHQSYRPIIDKIGVEPDFTKMIEMLPISIIKNPEERLKRLDAYSKKHKIEHSYYYAFLASCYKDLNQKKKALLAFKKAIQYDNFNFTAWNNLGQLYHLGYKNYSEAKVCYEKSISSKPDLDIPRLNLGILLSDNFKKKKEAMDQYQEILKFDECNPRAHNNLGNLYRSEEFLDFDKAEEHFLVAISQNLPESFLNYANFLKTARGKIELGNEYYKKAKELIKDKQVQDAIDYLLTSTKG